MTSLLGGTCGIGSIGLELELVCINSAAFEVGWAADSLDVVANYLIFPTRMCH